MFDFITNKTTKHTADMRVPGNFVSGGHTGVKSSQVELYCHSATCVDIQWDKMSCLTGPRCYMNTDIQHEVKQ